MLKVSLLNHLDGRRGHIGRYCIVQIGIIGGTGLDDPDIFQDRKEIEVNTIYGKVYSTVL